MNGEKNTLASLFGSLFDNLSRNLLYLVLVLGIVVVAQATLKVGYMPALALGALPLILFVVLFCIKNPYWALVGLFVFNYFLMGLYRRFPELPFGLVMDGLFAFTFFTLLIRSCYKKVGWERAWNGLTIAALIWSSYCILELFNPQSVSIQGWLSSFRSYFVYFLFIAILTPIIFYRYKDLKRLLLIWSVLTLLAVLKAYIQRRFGFTDAELHWLFVRGGRTTHIIGSGIRYFSFFSDAANFGSTMGFSMVVFGCAASYFKDKWLRIFYLAVALAAGYGMIISGTRSALAVPFAGFTLFIVISRQVRIILLGSFLVLGAFFFLNFTNIGQGNALIRRTRSAFNFEDKSFVVRMDNQRLMREYMTNKPFGGGLGHGGGKAKVFAPDAYLSQIPTDSWYVMVWVETGIVGLALHLGVLLYALGYGCWLALFRLRNKELRGITAALCGGCAGVIVAAYGNEILGFPSGIILYTCQAFIFLAPRFDRELMRMSQSAKALPENEYAYES